MTTVLVASDATADVDLVRRLLEAEGFECEGCIDPPRLAAEFERRQPQVLVLAFKSIEAAERHYLALYRSNQHVSSLPHRTLVLCQNEQTHEAYDRCRAGVFDDYVPFWPLAHDGWMLPKAVHNAMSAVLALRRSAVQTTVVAQAHRIAELEALLDAQISVGLGHADALARASEAARRDLGAAFEGLGQRLVEDGLDNAVVVRDSAQVHQAIERIGRQAVKPALEQVDRAMRPVREWAGGLKARLAGPVDAARSVASKTAAVPPRVLVVDDDRFLARTLREIFRQAGYSVLIAGDAAHAMQTLRRENIDLVLLDVGLPDVNGIDLLRGLKSNPLLASVPVLMLTGHAAKETIVACMSAGAADFVVKPFTCDPLLKKVERLLGAESKSTA